MDIKQILATLLANTDKLQEQDAQLLQEMVESYELTVEEPEPQEEHEVQESPETEQLEHETNVELGEATGEVEETPEEVVEEVPPTEEVVEEPVPQVDPIAQLGEAVNSLMAEIEKIKGMLSQASIREPIDEEDEEEEIGAKSKRTDAQPQKSNTTESLLAKLGGRSM